MANLLTKKDYKVIGISSRDPEKVIIELNRVTLNNLISTRKRVNNSSSSLLEYIQSGEVNNPDNVSWVYSNVHDLISDLNKLW